MARSWHWIALTVLLLLSTSVPHAIAADPLYVLNLLGMTPANKLTTSPILDGFHAALYSTGTGANGRTIQVIEPTNYDEAIETVIEKALTDYPDLIAMTGPVSDTVLREVLAVTKEKYPTLTAIGPITNFIDSSLWSPQAYFIRADPTAEIFSLVKQMVSSMHIRRVGLMHLSGFGLSDKGYEVVRTALYTTHQIVPIQYLQKASSTFNQDAFNEFADQNPQTVIVYAISGTHAVQFIMACNTRMPSVPIFFTSAGYTSMYQASIAAKNPFTFYFSSTNLLPTDTNFLHIKAFTKEMQAYVDSGDSVNSMDALMNSPVMGGLAVGGWLIGKILIKTLLVPDFVVSREAYQKALFNQKQYVIEDDVLIGPFGGTCSAYELLQRATCKCNQGGHTVSVYQMFLQNKILKAKLESTDGFSRESCYASEYTLPFYGQILILNISNSPALVQATASVQAGCSAAADVGTGTQVLTNRHVINATTLSDVEEYANDYIFDAIIGPIFDVEKLATVFELSSVIVNPIPQVLTPRIAMRNVLYITPTLDQEVYAFAAYAKETGQRLAVLINPSGHFKSIESVVRNAGQVYSIPIVIFDMTDSERIRRSLKDDLILLIGVSSPVLQYIVLHLKGHPSRVFCFLFEEFSIYYDLFVSLLEAESVDVQSRVLTQSNLPMWNDYSEETAHSIPDLAAYHKKLSDPSLINPLSLQEWFATRVLDTVMQCQYGNVTVLLRNCLYRYTWYNMGGISFGPYEWEGTCTDPFDINCRNYGATNISIISMARALNSSVPATWGPFSMTVKAPPSGVINLNVVLATSIPFLTVLVVIMGLCVYLCCWSQARNNRSAPKDPSKPVTLMFTDIQSSTALWAAFPQEMGVALEAHHRLIRKEIRRFGCYEVKTVGDSFMIATHDASKAVQLSIAIQKALFENNWGTNCFDAFYYQTSVPAEKENEHAQEQAELAAIQRVDSKMVTPNVETKIPETYRDVWNGLRVRAGLHTGLCDICHDAVTKGYDYYGDTVNTAARTESTAQGGQILITKSTWDNVFETGDPALLQFLHVTDVGAHNLRGVSLPVQMYQVESIPYREFKETMPAEEESSSEFDDDEESEGNATNGSRFRSPVAETTYKVMNAILSPFSPAKRLEKIIGLMTQWRVSTRVKLVHPSDTQVFQALLLRFVNRTCKVIAHREMIRDATENSSNLSSGGVTRINSSSEQRGIGGHYLNQSSFPLNSAGLGSTINSINLNRLLTPFQRTCNPSLRKTPNQSLRGAALEWVMSRHSAIGNDSDTILSSAEKAGESILQLHSSGVSDATNPPIEFTMCFPTEKETQLETIRPSTTESKAVLHSNTFLMTDESVAIHSLSASQTEFPKHRRERNTIPVPSPPANFSTISHKDSPSSATPSCTFTQVASASTPVDNAIPSLPKLKKSTILTPTSKFSEPTRLPPILTPPVENLPQGGAASPSVSARSPHNHSAYSSPPNPLSPTNAFFTVDSTTGSPCREGSFSRPGSGRGTWQPRPQTT